MYIKIQQFIYLVEIMAKKTDPTKLWRTIKEIDGRAKLTAENEAITFTRISFSFSNHLAVKFNQQFYTSTLGRLFKRDPISNEGEQEKTNGDDT